MFRCWSIILLGIGLLISTSCASGKKHQKAEKQTEVSVEKNTVSPSTQQNPNEGSIEQSQKKDVSTHDTSLFASMERTPCYGRCPTYKAVIYQNGYAEWTGTRFTEKIGKYTCTFSYDDMKTILKKAEEIGYFELNDVYDSQVTDLPSVFTSVVSNGKAKSIKSRHSAPEKLREFEKFLDSILEKQNWKQIEEGAKD